MSKASPVKQPPGAGAAVLDYLVDKLQLKNDAALARAFEVAPPVISKIRSDTLPFGDRMILKAHEKFNFEVADIRRVMADGAA